MQAAFQHIFKRLKGLDVCIAGGSVVDFDLATDIDVFVLDALDNEQGFEWSAMQDVVDVLNLTFTNYPTPSEVMVRGYFGDRALYASGLSEHSIKRIEVIGTSFQTAEELIDSFDLSIHAWALKNPHHIVGSMLNSTSRWESPRVMRWTTPEATRARMMKLVDRYRVPVSSVDWKRLNALIEKEKHAKGK